MTPQREARPVGPGRAEAELGGDGHRHCTDADAYAEALERALEAEARLRECVCSDLRRPPPEWQLVYRLVGLGAGRPPLATEKYVNRFRQFRIEHGLAALVRGLKLVLEQPIPHGSNPHGCGLPDLNYIRQLLPALERHLIEEQREAAA